MEIGSRQWCFSPHFPASLKFSSKCIFVSHVSNVSSDGYHCVRFSDLLGGRCEAVRMCYVLPTQAKKVRVAMLRIMVGSVAFKHKLPRKHPE